VPHQECRTRRKRTRNPADAQRLQSFQGAYGSIRSRKVIGSTRPNLQFDILQRVISVMALRRHRRDLAGCGKLRSLCHEIVDLVDGTVTESGTVGRITVPHVASCFSTSVSSSSTSTRAWSSWPVVIMPSSRRTTRNFARCWANHQPALSFGQNRRHVLIRYGTQPRRGAAPGGGRPPGS
jgi:hypothetical protein